MDILLYNTVCNNKEKLKLKGIFKKTCSTLILYKRFIILEMFLPSKYKFKYLYTLELLPPHGGSINTILLSSCSYML